MANQDARTAVRTALSMEDMMAAAFGNPEFYALNAADVSEGAMPGTRTAGTEGGYNVADAEKAKALLKKAGYDGKNRCAS